MSTQKIPGRHMPFEISSQVASYLGNLDLKNFRLVSSSCASIAAEHLYKIMSVSLVKSDIERLLKVARHKKYARMVKVLVLYELNFEEILSAMDGEQKIIQVINDHYSLRAFHGHRTVGPLTAEANALWEDWLYNVDKAELVPASSIDAHKLEVLVRQLAEEYHTAAFASRDEQVAVSLGEAFRSMPNLKTLILKMSTEFETDGSSIYHAPTLDSINQLFPLANAAIRTVTWEAAQSHTPDQTFLTILRVLAVTGADIDTLIVNCESRYLKQGMSLQNISSVPRNSVQKLRKISLCIRCTSATWNTDHEPLLADHLATANGLEHLELSWDSDMSNDWAQSLLHLPLTALLPQKSFKRLHTLVLDELRSGEAELAAFFLLQGKSLRNLTLLSCVICEDEGTWQGLFATLSASETVYLDRLTAKDLQDDTTFGAEADGRVLSRVKAEDLMEYVNNGGVHPYTVRKSVCNRTCTAEQTASRAWPNCCTLGRHSNDEVDEADFSDMSVWEERSLIDELDRDDYDLDGPEYHSDYEFDGEESIADSDMDLWNESSDPVDYELVTL